ncbi:MAG: hypothetical protein QNJ60_13235 [Xenococcaceae cyanobacterium MO_188.B19]|nr:hypothetical protein [Xenococcaceae cyanobacterium MO_188.B19]
MKGIQYLVNDEGKKTAVLIDLEEYGKLWADFQDILVSRSRANETEISWETLQAEIGQDVYKD